MTLNLNQWLMNPFVLMLLAILTGILLGKIRIGRFNFGISGTLFTGMIIGWTVVKYARRIAALNPSDLIADALLKNGVIPADFFYFFLVLFVTAVGLLAAADLEAVLRKYGYKFVLLGLLITFFGAAATYGLSHLFVHGFKALVSPYEVTGVYTGALTSSPGLAAGMESAGEKARRVISQYPDLPVADQQAVLSFIDESLNQADYPELSPVLQQIYRQKAESGVSVGYAVGYPFGVIIVILAVNFFPALFRINLEDEKKRFQQEMAAARQAVRSRQVKSEGFDLFALCFVMLTGYLLGKIGVRLNFLGVNQTLSLGITGGVLISALLFGYIGKLGPLYFRMAPNVLAALRQIGLAFFLAIVGLKYGVFVFDALAGSGIWLALAALGVGLAAMLAGYFFGRYVFRLNWVMLSGAICGGMTSTPGLGAAVDALQSDDPAAGYGAAYPFGLLGVVLFSIILQILPL